MPAEVIPFPQPPEDLEATVDRLLAELRKDHQARLAAVDELIDQVRRIVGLLDEQLAQRRQQ